MVSVDDLVKTEEEDDAGFMDVDNPVIVIEDLPFLLG